jgi:hypothetical protein
MRVDASEKKCFRLLFSTFSSLSLSFLRLDHVFTLTCTFSRKQNERHKESGRREFTDLSGGNPAGSRNDLMTEGKNKHGSPPISHGSHVCQSP